MEQSKEKRDIIGPIPIKWAVIDAEFENVVECYDHKDYGFNQNSIQQF
jgi:hypothetical protein